MRYVLSTSSQLSQALRSVRRARGLSQAEAGKLVGLLPKTISALENHPGSVTIDSFLKLLSALELELLIASKPKSDTSVQKLTPPEEAW